jgi:hypothetical protein
MHGLFSGHALASNRSPGFGIQSQKGGPRGNLCPIIWKFFGLH